MDQQNLELPLTAAIEQQTRADFCYGFSYSVVRSIGVT
jgi:hypothetical protein